MMENQAGSRLTIDYTGMMKNTQNPKGFSKEELLGLQNVLDQAQTSLSTRREAGEIDFSHKFVERFNFHAFDSAIKNIGKIDPRLKKT